MLGGTLPSWRSHSSPLASGAHVDTNSSDALPAGVARSFLGTASQNMSFALLRIES